MRKAETLDSIANMVVKHERLKPITLYYDKKIIF